jgi:MFS family permease
MLVEPKLVFSREIFIFAILAGSLCCICSSVVDDLFRGFIIEKSEINIKTTISKCLVLGITAGPLLGVIFYAFCHTSPEAIQTMFICSILFGIVAPTLSQLILLIYAKLFSQKTE